MSSSIEVPLVVLFGGGVESTTLVKRLLGEGRTVWPLYQHWGLHWEDCELAYARRFCKANECCRLARLIVVRYPHRDVLSAQWMVTGANIPRAGDPPGALKIPLRNLTLLTTAAGELTQLPELHLVMGTTADNSFSDGSREYFDICERLLKLEFQRPVSILTPLIHDDKTRVIQQSDPESLALSFSCLDPKADLHCGVCYKCGRRKEAFRKAGVKDPTVYADLV